MQENDQNEARAHMLGGEHEEFDFADQEIDFIFGQSLTTFARGFRSPEYQVVDGVDSVNLSTQANGHINV